MAPTTEITLRDWKLGDKNPFFLISGPCVIENEEHCLRMAERLKEAVLLIRYARVNKVPYFGICLGMQCAVIEFARHVCDLDAHSSEFDPSSSHREDLRAEESQ